MDTAPLSPAPGGKTLLRFLTCGSVDDGKSTLIGRLLYDAEAILSDQLETLERDSRKFGTTGDEVDLALLLDGLEDERQQGITIDVAYRLFATQRRGFIVAEDIEVVPLYFAKKRPVVQRGGVWIMVDDDRLPLEPGETPQMRRVRFRTLGCYPLTGAIESDATSTAEIVAELQAARQSERQGRLIDADEEASMERKKRDGYF